jgi:hypothetical protein
MGGGLRENREETGNGERRFALGGRAGCTRVI